MTRAERYRIPGARTVGRRSAIGGPPWQIPVTMIGLAAIAQVAGAAGLVISAGDLARGIFFGPMQLGVAHLYGLGFMTVAIIGALLQLVPVLLRRALCGPAMAWVIGLGIMLGGWMLAGGLWADSGWAAAAGGSLLVVAGATFLTYLAAAVVGARRAGTLGTSGAGIACAGAWFALVLLLGALMATNRIHPIPGVDRLRLIEVHAIVAIVGWIGGSIVALTLRLAPMFALSHGYRRGPGTAALVLWNVATLVAAIGVGIGSAPLAALGAVILLGACVLAGVFVFGIVRHRHRTRRGGAPLGHLATGFGATAAAAVALVAAFAGAYPVADVAIPAVVAVLVGLGAGVTSGNLFKVLPMLVWTGRYAHLAASGNAPRLSEMYPATVARGEEVLFAVGLAVLLVGITAGSASVAQTGAVLLLGAAVLVLAAAAVIIARPSIRARPSAQSPLSDI